MKKVLLTSSTLGLVLEAGLTVPTLKGTLGVAMITLGISEAGKRLICTFKD